LIEKLFDGQGNFIRKTFEPMLDDLATARKPCLRIAVVLFQGAERSCQSGFLPQCPAASDQPDQATQTRIALSAGRFLPASRKVEPSDRNAIMLANILLRTYNKELDVDIEMTPEEVLNVRNGLDRDVVHYAQFRIDSVEYRFSTKVRYHS
jgi:hypothetical protein